MRCKYNLQYIFSDSLYLSIFLVPLPWLFSIPDVLAFIIASFVLSVIFVSSLVSKTAKLTIKVNE